MPRKKRIQAEQEQEKPAPKKKDYMITVTEDEYDAHREELEKLDNVVIFVDDADRDHWMGAQWRLGVDLDPDIMSHVQIHLRGRKSSFFRKSTQA